MTVVIAVVGGGVTTTAMGVSHPTPCCRRIRRDSVCLQRLPRVGKNLRLYTQTELSEVSLAGNNFPSERKG